MTDDTCTCPRCPQCGGLVAHPLPAPQPPTYVPFNPWAPWLPYQPWPPTYPSFTANTGNVPTVVWSTVNPRPTEAGSGTAPFTHIAVRPAS